MKPNSTLAERRRRDRDRKLRERAKLAAQGIRPRQVWASDVAWAEVQPWLHALGITLAKRPSTVREQKIQKKPSTLAPAEQGML